MDQMYLIPANTKKGQLILNLFRVFDLILLGTGLGITFLAFMVSKGEASFLITILLFLPGLIATFLVLPIPNYHNVLVFLVSMYSFFTNQKIYKWKGWCMYEISDNKK